MGKTLAVIVAIITVWGALAQIMPGVFQVRRDSKLRQLLWGSKTKWVAMIAIGCLISWYMWTLEGRLDSLSKTSPTSIGTTDDTGLQFASWGPLPDGTGCHAVVDSSKLPASFRDKFDVALICGFLDPLVDPYKDTRISLSQLFTPYNPLSISVPFSHVMMESLTRDQEATIAKIQPPPKRGTAITLQNLIWMKVVLLPKGFDTANAHKLADVTAAGGMIASAQVAVGVTKQVFAK